MSLPLLEYHPASMVGGIRHVAGNMAHGVLDNEVYRKDSL
jgi:hypothetical protein